MKNQQRGLGRQVRQLAWVGVAGALLVAIWNVLPSHNFQDWWAWAQNSSEIIDNGYDQAVTQQDPSPAIEAWKSLLPTINSNPTPNTGSDTSNNQNTPPTDPTQLADRANDRLTTLTVADENSDGYDRDQWRHWDNLTSCWTVREAVLARDAEPGSLTLTDKDKRPTQTLENACNITGGIWNDPYTGETFTNPSDLDIDHLVPLKEAHESGGYQWDENTKRDYANNLASNHLIAVSASANRSKADKDPAQWMPPNTSIHCGYVASWIAAKERYGLTIDATERDALTTYLNDCNPT